MTGHPPETPAQASTFDRVNSNAIAAGLCPGCASQLAWAHQGGFGSVRPPCADCAPIVAGLPVAKSNGWRTVEGSAHLRRNWPGLNDADGSTRPAAFAATETRSESVGHEIPGRELRRSAAVDELIRDRDG